jgi:hypothetical protein
MVERRDGLGVRGGANLLSVGIDVPNPLDSTGELGLVVLGESNVLFAKLGERTRKICVFNFFLLCLGVAWCDRCNRREEHLRNSTCRRRRV